MLLAVAEMNISYTAHSLKLNRIHEPSGDSQRNFRLELTFQTGFKSRPRLSSVGSPLSTLSPQQTLGVLNPPILNLNLDRKLI